MKKISVITMEKTYIYNYIDSERDFVRQIEYMCQDISKGYKLRLKFGFATNRILNMVANFLFKNKDIADAVSAISLLMIFDDTTWELCREIQDKYPNINI